MCEALRERGVSIRTGEDVRHVIVEDGEVRGLITDKGELRCRAAILAPGRVGADWMRRHRPRSTAWSSSSAASKWACVWKRTTT